MPEEIKKVGILWGGGLGDLLMIRPFLMAAHSNPRMSACLLTTAAHATELFNEFCAPSKVILLPKDIQSIPAVIKKWRYFFDLIYLGPYPTLKTRVLGHLLAPQKLWSRYCKDVPPFLLEQVIADVKTLSLAGTFMHDFSSFLPWKIAEQVNPFNNQSPFLVLHPGAKEQWQTTLWPVACWQELLQRILEKTDFSVCFTGVANDAGRTGMIIQAVPEKYKSRIKPCLTFPIKDTASLIASSAGVICHNSGILHLATFLKKQTICITGSSAAFWRPPYPWVTNITSGACNLSCNKYRCPVPFFRSKCITSINVQVVWETFETIFKGAVREALCNSA